MVRNGRRGDERQFIGTSRSHRRAWIRGADSIAAERTAGPSGQQAFGPG